jgi:hypothetical protein
MRSTKQFNLAASNSDDTVTDLILMEENCALGQRNLSADPTKIG